MNTASDIAASSDKAVGAKQAALNVGMALREAREGLGLSVHDIADRIKFAPKQVEALEANDFSHLPEAAFLRGFVRSYARVLQLNEERLIASLPLAPSRQIQPKAPVVDVVFPGLLKLQRPNMLWLAGALGVAVILGLFILLHNGEQAATATDVVVEPIPLSAPEVAASGVAGNEAQATAEESAGIPGLQKAAEPPKIVEPKKAPEPVGAVEPGKLPEPKVETRKMMEPAKAAEPKKLPEPVKAIESRKTTESAKVAAPKITPEPASAKVPVAPAPVATTATTDKSEIPLEVLMRRPLHFVFGDATSVEVIDVHGNVLLSRNVSRGTEKWIGGPGRAPYDISISNPRKTKLYYKGAPIDLSGYPAAETAHLKVQ